MAASFPTSVKTFDANLDDSTLVDAAFADARDDEIEAIETYILTTKGGLRERLADNRTYYVRTDGSDSNTGLANTAGGAFLTIQKAIDTACGLDLSTYSVTIQVGNGTYTGANTLKSYLGVGPIVIIGDETTPANVVISTTSANCFSADAVIGKWQLKGMKLQTTTSGTAIQATKYSQIEFQNINFGTCVTIHIAATQGGSVIATGNSAISGGAIAHYYAESMGLIYDNTHTITSSGTFAFSATTYGFAYANQGGGVYAAGNTYTGGTITGKRYNVNMNAWVQTSGGGASYFPGDTGGGTATGGQYA